MAMLAEQNLPYVTDNKGYTTKKPIILQGAANFDASGSTGSFKFPSGAVTLPAQTLATAPIASSGATVALTASQSGGTFLFDRASGVVYTLPPAVVGTNFTFYTTVTITSGAAEVGTNNESTDFIQGAISVSGTTPGTFNGNGTTHVEVTSNGTTTGGILGGWLYLVCIAANLWQATGILAGSGTAATPFST